MCALLSNYLKNMIFFPVSGQNDWSIHGVFPKWLFLGCEIGENAEEGCCLLKHFAVLYAKGFSFLTLGIPFKKDTCAIIITHKLTSLPSEKWNLWYFLDTKFNHCFVCCASSSLAPSAGHWHICSVWDFLVLFLFSKILNSKKLIWS